MASPDAERAVEDAFAHGKAILRYITANEVGLTGSHQRGYYLPISDEVWPLFTPQRPEKGVTHTHPIEVTWPDGTVTHSHVKWYGDKSRYEYRLTNFNRIRGFTYLSPQLNGALLVIVPVKALRRIRHSSSRAQRSRPRTTASSGTSLPSRSRSPSSPPATSSPPPRGRSSRSASTSSARWTWTKQS